MKHEEKEKEIRNGFKHGGPFIIAAQIKKKQIILPYQKNWISFNRNPLFEINVDAAHMPKVRLKVEIGTFTLSFFYFSHLAVKLHF